MATIEIIECPRDAMQGYVKSFSLQQKVTYLKSLLDVGFHTLDIGSFVSPKAVPQMANTAKVLDALIPFKKKDNFLVIAANSIGVEIALKHSAVDIIGFPFSASETFQRRNTNRSRKQALKDLRRHAEIIDNKGKQLVVYISMSFGNPYSEETNNEEIIDFIGKINDVSNPKAISLSDTVAKATEHSIKSLVTLIKEDFNDANLGLHLHVSKERPLDVGLLKEAWNSGIRRFDSALLGFGGCPFAEDSLSGNLPTESLLTFAKNVKARSDINTMAFEAAHNAARALFL
ncbi:MAG: (R)-citramalyl-CoA lyase [Owenweeksia sp. TMED14]|nr:MAG: (R)-citramalyl-CoA lyase [Owenweeksia sp. TMED14]|tara:strand:+ start:1078 stop:1941 length:864 start_codon:yes stop_codon:yes gene_type:complete